MPQAHGALLSAPACCIRACGTRAQTACLSRLLLSWQVFKPRGWILWLMYAVAVLMLLVCIAGKAGGRAKRGAPVHAANNGKAAPLLQMLTHPALPCCSHGWKLPEHHC